MEKKKFIISLLFLIAYNIFANDTYFYLAGGSLVPAKETDIQIEMQEETIFLQLQKDYYKVTVDFAFFNDGETTELDVGFPFFSEGLGGEGKIWDFKCWTNGVKSNFKKTPIKRKWNKPIGLEYANIRKIVFPQKTITKTKVQYKAEYGRSHYFIANYLYGTGLSWKGKIGKICLIIENNNPYRIFNNVYMADKKILDNLEKTADNKYESIFYDVEPEDYSNIFEIELSDVLNNVGTKGFPAYFIFDGRCVVNKSILKWYTKEQLRLVRNAIYALHGCKFEAKDLQKYFESVGKEWNPPYKINPNFSINDLSDIEKQNIQNILEEEEKR